MTAQETQNRNGHTTITFRTDRGVVTYSALERPQPDEPIGLAPDEIARLSTTAL